MSYKQWSRWLLYASAVALCAVVVTISLRDQLIFYIHPRYVVFTTVFAAIGIVILLSAPVKPTKPTISVILFALLVATGVILPPRSISSQLAIDRDTRTSANELAPSAYELYTTDLTNFTIKDWAQALSSNSRAATLVGKSAQFDGFVLLGEDTVKLGRFQLTCCAVDASPLLVELFFDEPPQLEPDEWLLISGIVAEQNGRYGIQVDEYRRITQPRNPYVY